MRRALPAGLGTGAAASRAAARRRAALAALCPLVAALAWPSASPPAAPAPAVVAVLGERSAVATGFEARPGRVVTVAHVLDEGGTVAVRGLDGVRRQAAVLRIDRRNDLAVLAVAPAPPPDPVTADGTRLLVRRDGRIKSLAAPVRRRIDATIDGAARPALEVAADVAAGDSGAPLLTADGRLLGVVFASSARRAATAYAVDGWVLEALLG
jgi:S1-C subfamily serine protease